MVYQLRLKINVLIVILHLDALGVEVKEEGEKLVKMYAEYRKKQLTSTSSGSGACQKHPHQDLMDKLSCLSDKMSHRRGKSSIGFKKNTKSKEVERIITQKQTAGIIVLEPDRFSRRRRNNTDEIMKNELVEIFC